MKNNSIIAIGGLALMLWWLRQGKEKAETLIDNVRGHISNIRSYTGGLYAEYSDDQLQDTNVYLVIKNFEDYWTDEVLVIEADPTRIKANQIPHIVTDLRQNYSLYQKNLKLYKNEQALVDQGQQRQDGIHIWHNDPGTLEEVLRIFEEGIDLACDWRDFIYSIQQQLEGKESADRALESFDELRRSHDVSK